MKTLKRALLSFLIILCPQVFAADYYTASGDPVTGSSLSSSVLRSEYAAIAAGFAKIAAYTSANNRLLFINSGATAQTTDAELTYNGTTNVLTINGSTFGTNTSVGGTLGVTGATTAAAITTSGLITANEGISIPTGKTLDFVGTGGILGTATNDNAAAGNVGEVIEVSATAPIDSSAKNVTSINLTAGDWHVTAVIGSSASGANTYIQAGISPTSVTLSGAYGKEKIYIACDTTGQVCSGSLALRISLATPTTYYLVGQAGATMNADGHLLAVRIR